MVKDVMNFITQSDPEVGKAIEAEYARQKRNIELIASENIVSEAVMMAMGTVLTFTAAIPPGIGCMDAKFPSPGCGKSGLTGEKYSFSSTSTTASSKMPLFILILWTNASSKESHPV